MKNQTKTIFAAALWVMALFAGCAAASALTLEEAQQIALNTAGVTDVVFTESRLDPDDGVYEISFTSGGVEYEFEVDIKTGAVRELDRERAEQGHAITVPVEKEMDR